LIWAQPGASRRSTTALGRLAGSALQRSARADSFSEHVLALHKPQQLTFYFRTAFVVSTDLQKFKLTASTYLDDGAVLYLNGTEVLRRVCRPGPSGTGPWPPARPGRRRALEVWQISPAALVPGTNVLAVEVHQISGDSSDIVWGWPWKPAGR